VWWRLNNMVQGKHVGTPIKKQPISQSGPDSQAAQSFQLLAKLLSCLPYIFFSHVFYRLLYTVSLLSAGDTELPSRQPCCIKLSHNLPTVSKLMKLNTKSSYTRVTCFWKDVSSMACFSEMDTLSRLDVSWCCPYAQLLRCLYPRTILLTTPFYYIRNITRLFSKVQAHSLGILLEVQ